MAKRTKSYGLNNPLQDVFPVPVVARRIPNDNDTQYELGQTWVDQATSQIFALASITDGVPVWSLLGDTFPDGAPVTPFVVGSPSSGIGFSTIQAAIDAANAAGEGIVVVQPGTFTENLTLFDGIHVMGLTFADTGGGVVINGTHTPPASGGFVFRNVRLLGTNAILSSAVAGSAHLMIADSDVQVTNGHTYDLLNWTGKLEFSHVDSSQGTDDGCVNNTGGSEIKAISSILGIGTGQVLVTSGLFTANSTEFRCVFNCQTGTILALDSIIFSFPVALLNNTTGNITSSAFQTGTNTALVMDSSANVFLENCSIDSSNVVTIGGEGAGTLSLTGIDFPNLSNINAALTLTGGTTITDTFETVDPVAGINISSNIIRTDGTDTDIPMNFFPKGTGGFIATTSGGVSFNANTNSNFSINGAGEDLSLVTNGGSIRITATEALGDAIIIEASDAAGGIEINAQADTRLNSNLRLTSSGTQLQVSGGAVFDFIGQATLVAGTVTVANTNIAANDKILVTTEGVGASTAIGRLDISIIASTSFTITSLNPTNATTQTNDVSIVNYFIVRQL